MSLEATRYPFSLSIIVTIYDPKKKTKYILPQNNVANSNEVTVIYIYKFMLTLSFYPNLMLILGFCHACFRHD